MANIAARLPALAFPGGARIGVKVKNPDAPAATRVIER
jgi:hypothetical protein